MYLAGTIIFGGGPVVIPLLREYAVEPGWVSSRDSLLGLAIIQAFPGPNFNRTPPPPFSHTGTTS
jgi:chromate transport protein ChrA